MTLNRIKDRPKALAEAVARLQEAASAKKCHTCGCFHALLNALARVLPGVQIPRELKLALALAREHLAPIEYDCLGCEVCYPPLVMEAIQEVLGESLSDLEVCPAEKVEERKGWPPLPGAYTVLRYHAPVAVCTLMDDHLAAAVATTAGPEVALAGTLRTENLGIERLILNILPNPHIRFLLVCGADSRGAVGHFPGQSLVALAAAGLDEHGRIKGARGRRPFIRNVPPEAVEHFRKSVEVLNLIGTASLSAVMDQVRVCAARYPGPADPFLPKPSIIPIPGYLPGRMVPDAAGYFVIYLDRPRLLLSLEHYRNDGVLDAIIEGATAPELYIPAIDRGLVSRLDHAAYLGRELARAEQALRSGEPFVQDAAPEYGAPSLATECVCSSSCLEASP